MTQEHRHGPPDGTILRQGLRGHSWWSWGHLLMAQRSKWTVLRSAFLYVAFVGMVTALQPLDAVDVLLVVGVPLFFLTIAAVPLAHLAVVLVVSTQVTRGRFGAAGFHFLPEHFALVALGSAMVLRQGAVLARRAATYEVLLLAWILWSFLTSLSYSPDPAKSFAIIGWMMLAWLILWCLRSYFLASMVERQKLVWLGARVGAALGAASFVLWVVALLGGTTVGVQPEYVTGSFAAKGLALEANFLGAQALCWLFLIVRAAVLQRTPISPWQVTGLLLGMVASMTRAAWIAFMVVLATAFVVARSKRLSGDMRQPSHRSSSWRAALAGIVLAALLLPFAGPAGEKLQAAFDFGSTTGQARAVNWKLAWNDLSESGAYVTGLGTNSFGQRHLSRTLPGEPDYLGNLPLMVLYDSGIIGVLLFAAAMTSIVMKGATMGGRLFNLAFVLSILVVGAATSPIWFGFVWVTVAALDPDPAGAIRSSRALPLPDERSMNNRVVVRGV